MIRRGVLGVLLLVVAACGTTPARVAPADAMDAVPVRHAQLLAADDDHLWATDRDVLATYDRRAQRWTTVDLPGEPAAVDQVAGATVDGGLALLVGTCDGPCERMRENLDRLRTFVSPAPGALDEVPLDGDPRHYGGLDVVGQGGTSASFRTFGDHVDWLIDVGPDGATATDEPAGPMVVCPTTDGVIALESAPAGTPGALDPLPPPPASLAPIPGRRVTAGELGALRPLDLPADVAADVAHVLDTGATCAPEGLALLLHDHVWVGDGTSWTKAPADLPALGLYAALSAWSTALPDGTVVTPYAERTPEGTWRAHDPNEQVVVMGDVVVRHRAYP